MAKFHVSLHPHEIISQDGHNAVWWLFPDSGELCGSFTLRTEIPMGTYAPYRIIVDIHSIVLNKIRAPELGWQRCGGDGTHALGL